MLDDGTLSGSGAGINKRKGLDRTIGYIDYGAKEGRFNSPMDESVARAKKLVDEILVILRGGAVDRRVSLLYTSTFRYTLVLTGLRVTGSGGLSDLE